MEKTKQEYQKFLIQNISPVEDAYIEMIKDEEKTAKKKSKV
ncbi:MAG: hypothetical protein ACK5LL_10610 [Suipraeoptans sp.]